MKPKTYLVIQSLRCPYCQKVLKAEGRSDLSERAAAGIAEQGVYDKLKTHIKKEHTDVQ